MPCISEFKHRLTTLLFAAGIAVSMMAGPAMAQSQAARHRAADALALQAYNRMDQGDLEGAILKFRAAHKLNPKDKSIRVHLAEILTATGVSQYQAHHNAAAAARFQEALSLDPQFTRAHEYLSKVQFLQFYAQATKFYAAGDLLAARKKFALAVAAEPEHADAQAMLATTEADLMTLDATESSLKTAITKREKAQRLMPGNRELQQKLADSRTALALYEALAH